MLKTDRVIHLLRYVNSFLYGCQCFSPVNKNTVSIPPIELALKAYIKQKKLACQALHKAKFVHDSCRCMLRYLQQWRQHQPTAISTAQPA